MQVIDPFIYNIYIYITFLSKDSSYIYLLNYPIINWKIAIQPFLFIIIIIIILRRNHL